MSARCQGGTIRQLVAIAVLVEGLGGIAGPVDDGLDMRISVTDR